MKAVKVGKFLVKKNVVLVLRKLGIKYESMCKLEMMIESEGRKRMELNEIVNVLVVELEGEKY